MHYPVLLLVLSLLPLSAAHAAPPPFHAPAQSLGSLEVRLHPTEVVTTDAPRLVSFGLPLPLGSLRPDQLGTVRVLANGQELPAHVQQLTPWRHALDAAKDGQSVRVLRIQFRKGFSARFPNYETVRVEWGGTARSQHAAPQDPRSAWHPVLEGRTANGGPTFGPEHQVSEPDVYTVLPREWLATAGLKNPMAAMDASTSLERLNPATVPASFPGYREADQAQVNFLFSTLNDDDPNRAETESNTNFFARGEAEPWLYDRPMAYYVGYLRSGGFRFLREAVRNTEYYRRQLWTAADCGNGPCVGSFRLKNPDAQASWHDAKYSYNESLAMSYWLTGDERALANVEDVVRAYGDTPTRPNPTNFTERHSGFKLLAQVVAYELTGKSEYREAMLVSLADFRAGQDAPPTGAPQDGGLWHAIRGHEGDDSDALITSPWMSALLADAAARLYLVSEHAEAARLLTGLASHECGLGSYMTSIRNGENGLSDQSGGAHLRFPHYLATTNGLGWDSEFNPYSDFEHAHEVGATVAWGAYFAALAGDNAESTRLAACADEFYLSFSHAITYWTRPGSIDVGDGYDAYRVNPHRKYNWWFKNASGFAWAMGALADAPPPPANLAPTVSLSSPSANASFSAGSTLSLAAVAADSDGHVLRVEFYQGDSKLGEDTSAPYGFSWSQVPAGSYSLRARAIDNSGASTDSAPVAITVNAATPPGTGGGTPPASGGGGGGGGSLGLGLIALLLMRAVRNPTSENALPLGA
ncbi:MAG: Ig-like domain-containing protein [Gammaproteobacteria bacterium]|nr:Ig-like domain-containing protein [Gammaproteobacteria bacterium]